MAQQRKVRVDIENVSLAYGATQVLREEELHDGLLLDLYGTHDEDDGYTVLDVALAGTSISLHPLVSLQLFDDLSAWCNARLPTGAELRPTPGINTEEQRKILFGQTASVVR